MGSNANAVHREPWNKGKIVGQKAPFKLKDIWALRVRLQMESRVRELALFNLGIDSKLRGCDLVSLKVRDICHGDQVATRAVVMQHKTQRPVQFEITAATREAVQKWIKQAGLKSEDFVFPSRIHDSPHLGTRQYARILEGWVEELGLDPADYGTHSMRRTKATLIYRRTKNLRAVQLLLGHSKLDYLPRPTMSRRTVHRGCERMRAAGHSRQCYRLLRNASSLSSGRYLPGFPLGGEVLSRMRCFISRSASR
jgi:integrase